MTLHSRFPKAVTDAYVAPFPSSLYMGGVAKWPLLVPLFRDDPVAQHMVEARNCLKTWTKPALVMFGDEGRMLARSEHALENQVSMKTQQ